jgi:hypothetical protein
MFADSGLPRPAKQFWRISWIAAQLRSRSVRLCVSEAHFVSSGHYGADRLEAASARGLDIGARSYGSIQSILKHGLDRRPPPQPARQGELLPDHPNIRGPRYYH